MVQAYRQLAKRLHPDKGGDPVAFGRLQAAFDVLGNAQKRQVYDTWAKELEFRSVSAQRQVLQRLPCKGSAEQEAWSCITGTGELGAAPARSVLPGGCLVAREG